MNWKTRLRWFLRRMLVRLYRRLPGTLSSSVRDGKVAIVLYHEIRAELFSQHLEYLKKNYAIISLGDLKRALYTGTGNVIPANAMVITFDDGWKSNYSLLPVIKAAKIPVTIFLLAGMIDTHRTIWNYTLDRKGKDVDLNERLKKTANEEKDRKIFEVNGHFPEKEYAERSFLSRSEIEEMKPFVDFQSHGTFHPVYPMCAVSELHDDMADAKKILQGKFGISCYAIAYPYGRYGEREMHMAKEAGYDIGRTANNFGLNSLTSNPYSLKAIGIPMNADVRWLRDAISWAEFMTAKECFRRFFKRRV